MRTSRLIDPISGSTLQLSKLGLGCSQVGSFGARATPTALRTLMRQALDLGVTVFDTADIYGQGDSEREIGRALAKHRDQAVVITKFGKGFSTAMRLARPFKPILKPLLALRGGGGGTAVTAQRESHMREDFSPAHLIAALDGSLRRLKFDHVDVVMLHSPPTGVLSDPAVAEALMSLKTAGKARHIGASLELWDDLAPAVRIPGLTALQLPLDLIDRATAEGVMPAIRARGIAIFAREVIRLQPGLRPVQAVAAAAARPDVDCVIAGSSRLDHLEELAKVCS